MMRTLRVLGVALALGTIAVATACGSEGDSTFPDPTDDAGSSGSSGTSSSGSTGGLGGEGGTSSGGDASDDGPLMACATEQRKADPLPLDLYIMLDTSGSMATMVAQNVTKYKAVTDALNAFVNDTGSAGIGVGLQFFPLPKAGTPATCTSSAQCPGATGPCSVKACAKNGPLQFCTNTNECGGAQCLAVGRCANAQNVYCFTVGASCSTDANGFDRGVCQAQASGSCSQADSCDQTDYDNPTAPIAALPGAAGAITAALAAKKPDGNTPTSAALQGALDAAKAYAQANAGHTVVAVLATDGIPTECDTNVDNIATLAGTALAASPSIKTFVIGVFAADEATAAQANLDKIAVAGGTTSAFLVTQGATTTQQFIQAMNKIRGTALPCEYAFPMPEAGTPDYDKLNVQHTAPDGTKTILTYRENAGACDANGGWYYDADPKAGGMPTKIILCPATCTKVKDVGGQVDVVVGCKTQTQGPH